MIDLETLIHDALERNASDIHLTVGEPPIFRLDGELTNFGEVPLTEADTTAYVQELITPGLLKEFHEMGEADFAVTYHDLVRMRCNVFRQRGMTSLALRLLPLRIATAEELGLPPVVVAQADKPRGLVLVTGPTGSGKSSTLAALLDHINHTQRRHIITLEEPIEYLHASDQCIINQREVTEEERQALRDGSMTQEQLMERLTGSGGGEPSQPDAESAVPASRPESGGKTDAAPETPDAAAAGEKSEQSAESSYQKELSALIAKVYVLREEYTLALDTMYADAKAEYLALPAEKRTTTQLAKMAKGYLSRANALEKECDGKMDEVIRAMETLIRDNNGDLTLVDTVVYTYANEKSLKKSWYMTKLEQKGLL